MVKFDRSAVQEILQAGNDVEITVTGELNDDTTFEGSDTISIVSGSGDKTIKVWDAAIRGEAVTLSGHGDAAIPCSLVTLGLVLGYFHCRYLEEDCMHDPMPDRDIEAMSDPHIQPFSDKSLPRTCVSTDSVCRPGT